VTRSGYQEWVADQGHSKDAPRGKGECFGEQIESTKAFKLIRPTKWFWIIANICLHGSDRLIILLQGARCSDHFVIAGNIESKFEFSSGFNIGIGPFSKECCISFTFRPFRNHEQLRENPTRKSETYIKLQLWNP